MANKPDKRFLVFSFINYDASGGMQDCIEDFDTLDEAKEFVKKDNSENILSHEYQIYDRIKGLGISTDFI